MSVFHQTGGLALFHGHITINSFHGKNQKEKRKKRWAYFVAVRQYGSFVYQDIKTTIVKTCLE